MKKMIVSLAVLMTVVAVCGYVFAQSDYSTRTSWSLAKAPQGTAANIHQRQGMLVGHYIYDVDGALTTNVQHVIKEGLGYVTMPNNAIISSNAPGGWIDITTASDPASTTGAIYIGSTLIYTGALHTTGIYPIQCANTKLTTNSTLRIVASANIPTNALSVSVYVPYVLGN